MHTDLSCDETARLAALQRYQVLDTGPEEVFDMLTRLVAQLCNTPIALLNLIDARRNWFKSRIGIKSSEAPHHAGLCEHVVRHTQTLVIPDTLLDPRFAASPLVAGAPHIRFYAGVPLLTPDGHVLGALCAVDTVPRTLSPWQLAALDSLAREAMTQLELRRERLPLTTLRERLELILDTAGEGIYGLDPQGRTTFANRAAARMLGWEATELPGKSAAEVFYGTPADGPPADLTDYPLYKSLRDGEKHQDDHTLFRHREGHAFAARYTSTPLLQKGELLGSVLVFKDISERKRTEARLHASEERYRALYEDTPLIYFTLDQDGIVLSINRFGAAFLGYEPGELVGLPGRQTVLEDDKALVRQKFLAGLRNPQDVSHWEVRKVRKNGTVVWAREAMRVVHDEHGRSVALIVCQDITDLKHAETALQRERQFLKAVLENIDDGIVACDEGGTLTLFNHAARKLHGQNEAPLPPQQWAGHYHWYQADGKTRLATEDTLLYRALHGETVRNLEMSVLRRPDGVLRNVLASGQPLWDSQQRQLGAVAVLHDITKRRRAEQRLTYLTHYDPLTELPNRSLFYELLAQAIEQAATDGTRVAVLLLDLDRFKRINDTLGRNLSDLLLKAVAQRLVDCVREGDAVTRLSGDEFALILDGIVHPAGVSRAVQRILDAFAAPFQLEGHELFLTPSIGVSVYPADGADAEVLLANADTAMYRVKEQGRNGFQCYTPPLAARRSRNSTRQELEAALRYALARDELLLHYQPVVQLACGRISAVEALLRWQRPQGLVPRAQFVPLAEETGLILPLGIWALRNACVQACAWQAQGLNLRMALKFSTRQLQQPDFVSRVREVLAETGLEPALLEMQFGEAALRRTDACATLRALRKLGIQIAIDDYGAGPSSLTDLRHCAAGKLKIDQSFMRKVPEDSEPGALIRAIVAIAHSLHLKVTAEGVETLAQLNFLRALKCDEAQGYLFSKPLPAAAMAALLSGNGYAQLLPSPAGLIKASGRI